MAALERLAELHGAGLPVPALGSPEAEALFESTPTFAERQWAVRQAGLARPAHALRPEMPTGLVQIAEPKVP